MPNTTADRVTYQAAFSPEDGTVTLIRDVRAGICGPWGEFPATSREEAAAALFAAGYLVAGVWDVASSGDHWVTLTAMA